MKQIYPDLWQAEEESFRGMPAHAYLLQRKEGNVLFYHIRNSKDYKHISELGGIKYQYLSHHDDMYSSLEDIKTTFEDIKTTFDSKLCCHVLAEPYLKEESVSADILFKMKEKEFHSDNIEVIYTPGHCDNSLCYRYKSPYGKTYLFVGDTIYMDNGSWTTFLYPGHGNREYLNQSLKLLRSLEVDVIICSVAVGDYKIIEVTPSEWHSILDNLIEN